MATAKEDKIVRGADLATIGAQVKAKLNQKQDTLVSGTNIKTINNTSLLGGGDITILDGEDGKSAYQSWLDAGHSGTEADFLASLQGNSGYTGAAGELEVVNNDTQGGATAAWSAERGKIISKKIRGNNYETGKYIPAAIDPAAEASDSDYVLTDPISVAPGDEIVWYYYNVTTNKIRLGYYQDGEISTSWKNASSTSSRTITLDNSVTSGAYIRASFAVSQLQNSYIKINGRTVWTPGEIGLSVDLEKTISDVEVLQDEVFSNKIDTAKLVEKTGIIDANNHWTTSAGKCVFLPITPGSGYKIYNTSGNTANIAILQTSGIGTAGTTPSFATGYSGRIIIYNGDTYKFTVPDDGAYLYIRTKDSSNNDLMPLVYGDIKMLSAQVADMQKESGTMGRSFTLVGRGDTWVDKAFVLVNKLRYTVLLANPDVSMDGVTSAYARFAVAAYDEDGVRMERMVLVNTNQELLSEYVFTVPDGCASVAIGCRCEDGATFGVTVLPGNTSGAGKTEMELLTGTFNSSYNEIDTEPIRGIYSSLLKDKEDVETFMVFSDPHLTPNSRYETITEAVRDKYISALQKYYNSLPEDICICLGDWLNFKHTPNDAAAWLGYCDAYMRKLFKNYYPVLGNHDPNPYYPDSSSSSWLNALTYKGCENLMFRENGKAYYSFDGVNTKFYVLNSGVSFIKGMTDSNYSRLVNNRWEQIDWLANKLLQDDAAHSVLISHIYSNASIESEWFDPSTSYGSNGIHALSSNAKALLEAYNARTSITLNGITYNFSSCTGSVAFYLCGHTHFDYVDTSGKLPIVCITNLEGGIVRDGQKVHLLIPTFDNCIIDYDNNKLYMVRVGAGVSRIVNFAYKTLATGQSLSLVTELSGTITWTTKDSAKATVSDGVVSRVASGAVGIIATDESGKEEYWIIA